MIVRPEKHPPAAAKAEAFHAALVEEIAALVAEHDVVVVGMGWNPHVARARKALDAAGIAHVDKDVGNYAAGWKPRLALKMWAGWPTFPMVFWKGALLGGADETEGALRDGTLA
jgi:glutaredoxin-related protein